MTGRLPLRVKCPSCGRLSPVERKVCWGCGASLAAGTLTPAPTAGAPTPHSRPRPSMAPPSAPRRPSDRSSGATSSPRPNGSSGSRRRRAGRTADSVPYHGPPASGPRSIRPEVVGSIAAVAVGVVVVVAIILGYRSSGGPTTPSSGSPMPFSGFFDPAQSEQQAAPYGPWAPVAAFGVGTTATGPGLLGESGFGAAGCTVVWSGTTPTEVPATPLNAPVGQVAAWFLASSNAAGDVLITIGTNASGAVNVTNLAIVPGACLTALPTLRPFPASVVDSPAVAAAANAEGGSTFLSGYTGVTEEFIVDYAGWVVTYTTCSFVAPAGGSGNEFVASFVASTGVFENATTQPTTC